MNKIITISREFGSGGRELGRRLSEILGIAYYDQEIITEIANRTKLAEQYVDQIVEKQPLVSFPIHIGRTLYPVPNPVLEQRQSILLQHHQIIREMAQKSDCVIVGRCADYILKDFSPFRIFVYAELESRVARCSSRCTENEKYSEKELRQKILSVDKKRAKYYNSYTGQCWGDILNYDLCVNTIQQGIKKFSCMIAGMFEQIK